MEKMSVMQVRARSFGNSGFQNVLLDRDLEWVGVFVDDLGVAALDFCFIFSRFQLLA